jgi:hypothetical protein
MRYPKRPLQPSLWPTPRYGFSRAFLDAACWPSGRLRIPPLPRRRHLKFRSSLAFLPGCPIPIIRLRGYPYSDSVIRGGRAFTPVRGPEAWCL